MNTINGQPYSYYGYTLTKIEGALDMPSRIGEVVYDWGNYTEPLVDKDDIAWKDIDITATVLFDKKRYDMLLSESFLLLKALPKIFVLGTKYGDFNVKLKQVVKVKEFVGDYTQIKLVFNENKPQFTTSTLGIPLGGNGTKIDDFDFFNDLGIIVSETKFIDDMPVLKQSDITVFKSSKPFTENRSLRSIQFSCNIIYSSFSELKETTEKIKFLLSKEGYRTVNYKGRKYTCFFTKGFNIKTRNNLASLDIQLKIATNFVDFGFVASGFISGI